MQHVSLGNEIDDRRYRFVMRIGTRYYWLARWPPETAAQNDGEGQETEVRCVLPVPSLTTVGVQASAPPAGSVDT